MDEINNAFNNYMNEVKKLDTNGKRKELYDSLMSLGNSIIELANHDGINLHYLQNKEVNDLFNYDLSEDDYLDALLVFFYFIHHFPCVYLF